MNNHRLVLSGKFASAGEANQLAHSFAMFLANLLQSNGSVSFDFEPINPDTAGMGEVRVITTTRTP